MIDFDSLGRERQVAPALNLHIEPKDPIELDDMLASLATLGKRFQTFAREELADEFRRDPKLYVSSIKPGSIDISLIPDFIDAGKAAAGAVVAVGAGDTAEAVKGFAESIKGLLDIFRKPEATKKEQDGVSIRDCDDAVNIVKPIAASGGSQTFNVNNNHGTQIFQFNMSSPDANRIIQNALEKKASLLLPQTETRASVALVWQKIDKSLARTDGATSPDKGRIDEIDAGAKSILFAEDMAAVKAEIMDDAMLKMVYYVDVEVVRVDDKIKAYRVIRYHGKDPLND
ncbi:hypothetical protein F4V91_13590 [Neorhizobium galegae]|uniref:Uncharacterized protein n=1 Tax=Neorhizobium galegae TaxID=399 RepID=A0A6A1TTK8_NEOGA|nr:hypothetical protein [Neorhizobium galegae]KAB1087365.1 hypothetical protein F4V91_13590 [Neorhizobium galegae]